ncbi:MAG TPA: PepSY-like domain-containing protein [Brumimicrobium sp.]|nr:PepSY-like domain-containing protein [Brumimicrobium sp.]
MKKHFNKILVATIITSSVIGGAAIAQGQNSDTEKTTIGESVDGVDFIAEVQFRNDDKKEIIAEADLPKEIKKYIAKHFPDSKVLQAEREETLAGFHHEVKLDKGVELEFDGNNKIVEIDGTSILPESVIPATIFKYVKTNYPENGITDWKLEGNKQEVELDNGIELEFNKNGEFVRIDK